MRIGIEALGELTGEVKASLWLVGLSPGRDEVRAAVLDLIAKLTGELPTIVRDDKVELAPPEA